MKPKHGRRSRSSAPPARKSETPARGPEPAAKREREPEIRSSLPPPAPFSWSALRTDALAGLTVALVGLPQCVAYAMMSGLAPSYGLVTAAVPGLLAAIAGKSAQVVTGPTNTTSLLVLGALGPWLASNGLLTEQGLPVLATLTLLAGAIRILGAVAGGAELLRFLPESVLVGFTAGAGILIATMQLDEALGLGGVRADGLVSEVRALFDALASGRSIGWPALGVAIATGAAVALGSGKLRRFPIALGAVIAAMAAAYVLGLDENDGLPLVHDRASVPNGWPPFASPDVSVDTVSQLFVPAISIAVLGTLELTVAARRDGGRPDMKRELLAQGVANVGGAFVGSFPASASLLRSALLRFTGSKTRAAAAIAAVAIVPILFAGGASVGYIPQASLAGVLFVTAWGMIDRERTRRMWQTGRSTRVLLVLTLVATLLLPLEWSILIGAGAGLLIHIARTSEPRVRFLILEGERLVPLPDRTTPEIVVVEVSGNLHYAAVPAFGKRLAQTLPRKTAVVIVDLSHAHELRFAALTAFEALARELEARGARLYLAGVSESFADVVERSESTLRTTAEDREPGASVRRAIERARAERG
jgi:SulP family sulfate permease